MVRSALVPWETRMPSLFEGPRAFDEFRREMDRLMADFFGEGGPPTALTTFAPQMNVAETDKDYEITIDLPGVTADEVSVELHDGNLVISGERKEEKEEKGKTYRKYERSYGQFSRSIAVGPDVKPDQIDAHYKDGVLKVTLPKTEAAQAKRIPIKT